MNKTIVAHPDNIAALEKAIHRGEFDPPDRGMLWSSAFTIRADPHMEKDKPTGKYKTPSGKLITRDQIRFRSKYITYGPEDLHWLLAAGHLTEEREMLFYVVDMSFLKSFIHMPMIMQPQRSIIATSTC